MCYGEQRSITGKGVGWTGWTCVFRERAAALLELYTELYTHTVQSTVCFHRLITRCVGSLRCIPRDSSQQGTLQLQQRTKNGKVKRERGIRRVAVVGFDGRISAAILWNVTKSAQA